MPVQRPWQTCSAKIAQIDDMLRPCLCIPWRTSSASGLIPRETRIVTPLDADAQKEATAHRLPLRPMACSAGSHCRDACRCGCSVHTQPWTRSSQARSPSGGHAAPSNARGLVAPPPLSPTPPRRRGRAQLSQSLALGPVGRCSCFFAFCTDLIAARPTALCSNWRCRSSACGSGRGGGGRGQGQGALEASSRCSSAQPGRRWGGARRGWATGRRCDCGRWRRAAWWAQGSAAAVAAAACACPAGVARSPGPRPPCAPCGRAPPAWGPTHAWGAGRRRSS